jgi:hypothetical protein
MAFELDEAHLATIASTGGRKATPSTLLAEVQAAIGTDKAFGIAVVEGVKPTSIVSELHKAAVALGVKVKVWNRAATESVPPFVGFKVKPEPTPTPVTPAA